MNTTFVAAAIAEPMDSFSGGHKESSVAMEMPLARSVDANGGVPYNDETDSHELLLAHLRGRRILVTGGCGFIGTAFIRYVLRHAPRDTEVYNIDKLEYCAGVGVSQASPTEDDDEKATERQNDANCLGTAAERAPSNSSPSTIPFASALIFPRYHFIIGSILDADLILNVLRTQAIDTIVHMAAQTHVDNSFSSSLLFTQVNVVGTHTLLECARQYGQLKCFLHVSTDEVYGETPDTGPMANEQRTVLRPTNPYAATKAAAEHLVQAYHHSFHLPILISRGNNVYGPGQYPEKVIPRFMVHALRGERLPIHGNGHHLRSFLYVEDVVRALLTILVHGTAGEVYNIASDEEWSVHQVARHVMACVAAEEKLHTGPPHLPAFTSSREDFDNRYVTYVADRAYNDARYSIENTKLAALGWSPTVPFEEGLRRTLRWYRCHPPTKGGYWKGEEG